MAKILDKLFPTASDKAIKLHSKYDWLVTERSMLEDLYEEKKNKILAKFDRKANQKIASASYDACDKTQYANDLMMQEIKEYDIKSYLSHRAVNHKAAKGIFKAVKRGEDFTAILETMKASDLALLQKRAAAVASFTEKRDRAVRQNLGSNSENYKKLSQELQAERKALSDKLDAEYGKLLERDKAKLTEKIAALEVKMADVESKQTTEYSNPDDVILSVKGLKMYFGGLSNLSGSVTVPDPQL